MREIQPRELSADGCWSILTMRDFDPADPRKWVEHVLTVCQRIAAVVRL